LAREADEVLPLDENEFLESANESIEIDNNITVKDMTYYNALDINVNATSSKIKKAY